MRKQNPFLLTMTKDDMHQQVKLKKIIMAIISVAISLSINKLKALTFTEKKHS
jgi:hypothetical protein